MAFQMNFIDLPRDENDYRFIKSFKVDQTREWLQFFDEFGFVVISDALTEEECRLTKSEMFDLIEKQFPLFDRNDCSTWKNWESESFGMSSKTPIFSPQILKNRQNEKIYSVFSNIIGSEKILVNHDRWAIYRPTLLCGDHFRTPDNIHLDINPWRFESDDQTVWSLVDSLTFNNIRDFVVENTHVTKTLRGRQLQGIINLHDNDEFDGGLVLIPGFHTRFSEWVRTLGPMNDPECRFKIPKNHPFQKFAQRITCRAGSLVIWDQRMIHGSRGNQSTEPRFVQFIKMFSFEKMSKSRKTARRKFIEKELKKIDFNPSPIGSVVFGFKQ